MQFGRHSGFEWGLLRHIAFSPCGSVGKESACNVGDLGLMPGLGRSPGEVKGYPLRYSGLENSMDYIVHEVAKSWTRLSDFHFFTRHIGSGPLHCFLLPVWPWEGHSSHLFSASSSA